MTDKSQQPEDQSSGPAGDTASDPAEKEPTATAETQARPSKNGSRSAAEPPPKSSAASRSGGKRPPNWSAFLLVLILLASVGGLAYYQWLHRENYRETVADLNAQLEAQTSQLADLSQSQQQLQGQLQSQQQQESDALTQVRQQNRQLDRQLDNLAQQVTGFRQQMQALSTTTTEDWKLAEAYYLTRLAGQRLLMERDTDGALALLEAADAIATDSPDPDLRPVRGALADDIAALKVADRVDREGLYLRIGALSRQIANLPTAERLNYQPQTDADQSANGEALPADNEAEGVWQSIQHSFQNALTKLENLVRVSDQRLQPLLPADQQLYLRSSLQTQLDTAQLAVLREEQTIYQASLEKAQDILAQVYPESAQRARVLQELQALADTNIEQTLPDISASQEAFATYLEQRHSLPNEQSEPSQQGEQSTPPDTAGEAQEPQP